MTAAVKATLKVILQANDTVVAESQDANLWQRVLTAITQGTDLSESQRSGSEQSRQGELDQRFTGRGEVGANLVGSDDPVGKFAQHLGLPREVVEGACAPGTEPPYLHLDVHCWEDMKRQTPERGPTAISPIGLAATLLTLWFRAAGLGNPTQAQAHGVLATIHIRDHNPTRSIQRADWLQQRPGGVIVLNPAQASRAINLAKAFCSREWKKRQDD
jgi:hypothetical protein